MGEFNFIKDLSKSDKSTIELVEALSFLGFKDFEYGKDYLWDIRCTTPSGAKITIEYKDDYESERTGNVAIEYSSRKNWSGILKTQADYWLQKVAGLYYIVRTTELKTHIIKLTLAGKIKSVEGGDNNTSLIFLIKIQDFKEIAKLLILHDYRTTNGGAS